MSKFSFYSPSPAHSRLVIGAAVAAGWKIYSADAAESVEFTRDLSALEGTAYFARPIWLCFHFAKTLDNSFVDAFPSWDGDAGDPPNPHHYTPIIGIGGLIDRLARHYDECQNKEQ